MKSQKRHVIVISVNSLLLLKKIQKLHNIFNARHHPSREITNADIHTHRVMYNEKWKNASLRKAAAVINIFVFFSSFLLYLRHSSGSRSFNIFIQWWHLRC